MTVYTYRLMVQEGTEPVLDPETAEHYARLVMAEWSVPVGYFGMRAGNGSYEVELEFPEGTYLDTRGYNQFESDTLDVVVLLDGNSVDDEEEDDLAAQAEYEHGIEDHERDLAYDRQIGI